MRTELKTCLILTATVLMSATLLYGAGEKSLLKISSKPVRVALFKNGLGFVEREGTMPKGVLAGELGLLPIPVHGTFWVYPKTEGAELRKIVASSVNIERDAIERDVTSIAELLEANDGRELELAIIGADSKIEQLKGKVRVLRGSQTAPVAVDTFESGFMVSEAAASTIPTAVWRSPAMPTSARLLL
ncbi:MAG: hypothetical protein NTY53_17130, partial [Kiritimatiellaeota bacterium]|nr:hypothetical protein [Kiritimatiellota bacterium]